MFRNINIIFSLCSILSSISLLSIDNPEKYYSEGEHAKTVIEREEAFNQALEAYSSIEAKNQSPFGNGTLFYNMGNTYFQLNEYAWAVYYYYRALKLQPRNQKIIRNLNIALTKLGLPEYKERKTFHYLFFFQQSLSLPEQIKTVFLLTFLIAILFSLYVWGAIKRYQALLIIPLLLWVMMMATISYSYYFSPLEGVMVENSALFRDAGEHFAQATEFPVREGSKIRVLDVTANGTWLKVLTPQGKVGYIPHRSIRLID